MSRIQNRHGITFSGSYLTITPMEFKYAEDVGVASGSEFKVMIFLLNQDGREVAYSYIADCCNLNERTVKRIIQDFKQKNLISWVKGLRGWNVYTVSGFKEAVVQAMKRDGLETTSESTSGPETTIGDGPGTTPISGPETTPRDGPGTTKSVTTRRNQNDHQNRAREESKDQKTAFQEFLCSLPKPLVRRINSMSEPEFTKLLDIPFTTTLGRSHALNVLSEGGLANGQ